MTAEELCMHIVKVIQANAGVSSVEGHIVNRDDTNHKVDLDVVKDGWAYCVTIDVTLYGKIQQDDH